MVNVSNNVLRYVSPSAADDSPQRAMGMVAAVKGSVSGAAGQLGKSTSNLQGSSVIGLSKKLDAILKQGIKGAIEEVYTPADKRQANIFSKLSGENRKFKQELSKMMSRENRRAESLSKMTPAQRQEYLKKESAMDKKSSKEARSILEKVDKKLEDDGKRARNIKSIDSHAKARKAQIEKQNRSLPQSLREDLSQMGLYDEAEIAELEKDLDKLGLLEKGQSVDKNGNIVQKNSEGNTVNVSNISNKLEEHKNNNNSLANTRVILKTLDDTFEGKNWATSESAMLLKKLGLDDNEIQQLLVEKLTKEQMAKAVQESQNEVDQVNQMEEEAKYALLRENEEMISLMFEASKIQNNPINMQTSLNYTRVVKSGDEKFGGRSFGSRQADTRQAQEVIDKMAAYKEKKAPDLMNQFGREMKEGASYAYNNPVSTMGKFATGVLTNFKEIFVDTFTGEVADKNYEERIKQHREVMFDEKERTQSMQDVSKRLFPEGTDQSTIDAYKGGGMLQSLLKKQSSDMSNPTDGFMKSFDYESLNKAGYSFKEIVEQNQKLENPIPQEDFISLRGPKIDELTQEMSGLNREQIVDILLQEKISSASVDRFMDKLSGDRMMTAYDYSDLRDLGISQDEINAARGRRLGS